MDWELVTWGLLIGIVGMIWMMVLSILNEGRTSKTIPEPYPNGSHTEPASHGQEGKEAA